MKKTSIINRINGKVKFVVICTIISFITCSGLAQVKLGLKKNKFSEVPDQGISGTTHEKYLGKIVFSNERISKDDPEESEFKERFNADEPLYGRYYYAKSAANTPVYQYYDLKKRKTDGPCRGDCKYALNIFREGSDGVFTARCGELNGEETEWTTWQLSINPVADDPEQVEKFWVNLLNELAPGEYNFRAELVFGQSACSFNPNNNNGYAYVSDPVAVGNFTIVKEAGMRVKFNRTFATNFEPVMRESALEGKMLSEIKRYAKAIEWNVQFSKLSITEAWEYQRNDYGVLLSRTCHTYAYGIDPNKECAGYPFLFKQEALNNGDYGPLQIKYEGYYGKSGVDCSE